MLGDARPDARAVSTLVPAVDRVSSVSAVVSAQPPWTALDDPCIVSLSFLRMGGLVDGNRTGV